MKTTLTVWNKTVQNLALGDEEGIKLAFFLCSDKIALISWSRLGADSVQNHGLPYIEYGGFSMIRNLVRENSNILFQNSLFVDPNSYLENLKQKL